MITVERIGACEQLAAGRARAGDIAVKLDAALTVLAGGFLRAGIPVPRALAVPLPPAGWLDWPAWAALADSMTTTVLEILAGDGTPLSPLSSPEVIVIGSGPWAAEVDARLGGALAVLAGFWLRAGLPLPPALGGPDPVLPGAAGGAA
jgi:hypothetical protein